MVECTSKNGKIKYLGTQKPSVDTPIQIELYKRFPKINFMIHGHNQVHNAISTKDYYPCGDMREVEPVQECIEYLNKNYGVLNLKNHGFLIYADTIENLKLVATRITFKRI